MKKPMKPVRKSARKPVRKVARKVVRKAKKRARQVRKPLPVTIAFPWAKLAKIAKTLELARAQSPATVTPELEAKMAAVAAQLEAKLSESAARIEAFAAAMRQEPAAPMPGTFEEMARELAAIANRPMPGAYEPAPIRFVSLESVEPGQVHIRADSIEVISHPVQKAAGDPYILYLTLKSGQKSAMLDTPENRTALGIPLQTPDVGIPRAVAARVPKGFKPAKIASPKADPNAEPQAHDEDDDA